MDRHSLDFGPSYYKNSIDIFITRPLRYILFFLLLFPFLGSAQVGISTTDIDLSAVLEIESSDKGVLFPSLTLAQRDLVSSPADGLTIYCNDCCLNNGTGALYYYDGANWKSLDSTCSESLAPPCIPTVTTIFASQHLSNASIPLVFDVDQPNSGDGLKRSNQTDWADLRMHQDNRDIWEFALSETLLPGFQILLYWDDHESANNLGLIVDLDEGATTSQASIDTLLGVLPDGATNLSNGDRDHIITINVIANTDTITVKSSQDGRGDDPYLLEIIILDELGERIPFTCT
tara:strand:- start:529 stop:1398 length:870 start_codon:yes stop_codon:yes gene_type:complete